MRPQEIPKRSDQRRRRNRVNITHAPANDEIDIPEPDEDWHPVATQWYLSLLKSGQRVFYENSDWAQAFYIAEAMSRSLRTSRISANMFAAVIAASHALLTTEGARRQLRIELDRANNDNDPMVAVAMADYRRAAELA